MRLEARSVPLLRGKVEMRLVNGPDGRRLETTTAARFLGVPVARSETSTTFDPATGRVREYVSHSHKRGRRYRFEDEGYTVEKLRPREDDGWEVTSRREFTWPSEDDGTRRELFDYYGMLLHLRETRLAEPGDEITLHVATSDGPEAYRITVGEKRRVERSFTDLGTGEKTTRPLDELRLAIVPADPEAEEGFLNMIGETEVWVEAESKTPVEIGGDVPKVPGRVRLVLDAMDWTAIGP